MSMSIFLSHMDTAPAEYHVIVLLSYLISIDPLIFNCFDVHRHLDLSFLRWIRSQRSSPWRRSGLCTRPCLPRLGASGLEFHDSTGGMSAYYKSIQNQAVLCSTIKSSAKNQTKKLSNCPNILYTSPAICFLLHFWWDLCLFDRWHQNWCELQGGVAPLIMPLGYSFRGQ